MAQSITEWGLAFAVAHDLEVRPGNEGEIGPPRGFSLHVRGMAAGKIFRYDPEGKPHALLFWLPAIDPQLEPVRHFLESHDQGFSRLTDQPPYYVRRWKEGTGRSPLATVMEHLVAITQASTLPDPQPSE